MYGDDVCSTTKHHHFATIQRSCSIIKLSITRLYLKIYFFLCLKIQLNYCLSLLHHQVSMSCNKFSENKYHIETRYKSSFIHHKLSYFFCIETLNKRRHELKSQHNLQALCKQYRTFCETQQQIYSALTYSFRLHTSFSLLTNSPKVKTKRSILKSCLVPPPQNHCRIVIRICLAPKCT